MKKTIFLFALLPALLLAQANTTPSVAELEAQMRDVPIQNNFQFKTETYGKKSPVMAIVYSMLLPGMGELYAGNYESGKYFTIAEGVFWGALIGFNTYGNWQEDNYKSYAASNGNVDLTGKDEDFYTHIGEYINVEDYNREQELNREFYKTYDTETHYWNWKDNDARQQYKSAWRSSEQAYTNVRFAVAAMLVNRIVSAINAVRLVSSHNKALENNVSWNLSYDRAFDDVYEMKVNLGVKF